MAKKIVLAGACRTAIGSMGGALSTTPAPELGSIVIKEALNRAGVAPEQVDHVYMGCVIQAGLGQNVARQASLKAGLPVETPAVTVNVVCGSGLNCVNMAAQMIQAGDADIVVAGGMENMSMAPYALKNARYGYRMGNAPMIDTMVNDALWDAFNDYHMGITAENVAEQWGLTREQLDEFAAASQQKACAAIEAGKFKDEIVPVEVKKKKETIVVDTDEGPRPGTTAEGIARLRPAFKKDGIVTAANASSINDGAAAIVVMSEEKAKELGMTLNRKKTRIVKLSDYYKFLQITYSLTDTGRVIRKINPRRIVDMRRKLKKLSLKVIRGERTQEEVENMFRAWMGGHAHLMSKIQRDNLNLLYFDLFGGFIDGKYYLQYYPRRQNRDSRHNEWKQLYNRRCG